MIHERRASFAAFGPRAADGRAAHPWHPLIGKIDGSVTQTWRAYEIRSTLEENWDELGPHLQNRLHNVGSEDNFYIEISLRMPNDFLHRQDRGGYVEIHPGNHGSFLTSELIRRM